MAPLRGRKGTLYEGGIRVPLIVRLPDKEGAASVCRTPVVSTDFYPTMLDLAGLPLLPEQHRDGKSLAPLLMGEAAVERDAVFFHYPHYVGPDLRSVVRRGNYKLHEVLDDGHLELYDLRGA